MIVHVQLDGADRTLPLAEFEALVRDGRVGALTPVRIDVVTGDTWVAAGTLELWRSLASSPEAQFTRAWSRPAVPWVTASICGICIRLFAWGYGTEPGAWVWTRGARVSAEVVEHGESWRLLSYGFLHAGLEHIANNLLFLAYAGIALETVVGGPAVAALFLASVVSGGTLSGWLSPDRSSVGASAGDFGFLVAAIVFGWRYLDLIPARAQARFGGAIVLFAGIGFINGLFASRVDNWGHFGGVLAGLVVGAMLRPGADAAGRRHNRRVALGVTAVTLVGMGAVAAAGPRLLPWTPWEEDGLALERPAWWEVGWTGNQDRGWRSPTGDAAMSARTLRHEHPVTLDEANRELLASYRTVDDQAAQAPGETPAIRGEVTGRRVHITWSADGKEWSSDAEIYVRGRYVQTVIVEHAVAETRLGEALIDGVFDALTITAPAVITTSVASARPDTVRGQLALAAAATDLGDVPRAVSLYRSALQAAPEDTGVWEAWLGNVPDLVPDEAAAEAEAALVRLPENRRVRVAAAYTLAAAGQRDRAVIVLQEGLVAAPGDTTLGRALRQLQRAAPP